MIRTHLFTPDSVPTPITRVSTSVSRVKVGPKTDTPLAICLLISSVLEAVKANCAKVAALDKSMSSKKKNIASLRSTRSIQASNNGHEDHISSMKLFFQAATNTWGLFLCNWDYLFFYSQKTCCQRIVHCHRLMLFRIKFNNVMQFFVLREGVRIMSHNENHFCIIKTKLNKVAVVMRINIHKRNVNIFDKTYPLKGKSLEALNRFRVGIPTSILVVKTTLVVKPKSPLEIFRTLNVMFSNVFLVLFKGWLRANCDLDGTLRTVSQFTSNYKNSKTNFTTRQWHRHMENCKIQKNGECDKYKNNAIRYQVDYFAVTFIEELCSELEVAYHEPFVRVTDDRQLLSGRFSIVSIGDATIALTIRRPDASWTAQFCDFRSTLLLVKFFKPIQNTENFNVIINRFCGRHPEGIFS
ncbi:hypothetical protein HUJ05_013097 [Dendroctonus ponderosae]|nr:hypothetical protein HUJ05_013097 [Dendroctonus ponderosae]